ncbi:hypothetical protein AQUCO_05100036v1 [Aquilegia coerulea]|uniref:Uncharacterized protein n=2 Tax=Aquilegia coerulea TaxID=218851 RepID=A0A2G5CIX9_AQUCA|nr:hypothetical protein AQUCO_05100036v1 [Aquilegia coerulea]
MVSKSFIVLGFLAVVFLNSSEVLSKNASGGTDVSSDNFTESAINGDMNLNESSDTNRKEGSDTDSNQGFDGGSNTDSNQGSNTDSNDGGGSDTENNGVSGRIHFVSVGRDASFRRLTGTDTDGNGGGNNPHHVGKEGRN